MSARPPQKSSLLRSHSMKLTTSTRPGLTSAAGPIRSSASWSAFNGQSFRQLEPLTGRPVGSRLTPNNNNPGAKKHEENITPVRHNVKPTSGPANRHTDQRLTGGGGVPLSSSGPLQRRMSLDTTPLSQLPGNRPHDASELKSILKHHRRSLSISYGEMAAKTARASHNSFSPSSAFTSALLLTAPPSFISAKSPDEDLGLTSDEALLKNCQYRLGPTLTSAADSVQKKVKFVDEFPLPNKLT